MKDIENFIQNSKKITVYNLAELVNLKRKDGDIEEYKTISVNNMANVLFNHIVTVSCNEPKNVLKSSNIVKMYMDKALETAVDHYVDHPLLPDDFLEDIDSLDDEQLQDFASLSNKMADSLYDNFVNLSKVKVIDTGADINIYVGDNIVPVNIPIVTETTKGLAGIFPYYDENNIIPEIMSGYNIPTHTMSMNSLVLWDMYSGKTIKKKFSFPKELT